jgi:DNA sulfur modification protein DndD
LAEASKQLLVSEEDIKKNEHTLADLKRKHLAICERLQEAAGHVSKVRLVQNVQKVLEEYKSELLKRKIAQIEQTVSDCFNSLCRKTDTLRRISVNPKTFSVTLYDKRDQALPKEQLSAGEKQIYAVSMLWGLAKTADRPLPVIIDTPLARLDSDHRRLLIHNYFPEASHQVMILSTDTEVDQSYFNDLKREIAHSYKLEFDPEESCTKVSSGYFWKGSDETH